jgi:hypothetical protein
MTADGPEGVVALLSSAGFRAVRDAGHVETLLGTIGCWTGRKTG